MSIVAFVVVLCALVVIHEFGHFIVAKMLGIGVEVFSVGFGKRLWGFKLGETDYRLSLVPLGGYVRFRGENLEMLQGKSDAPADEFNSHPKWKRLLVAFAGPAFNIAFAILIPTIGILTGYEVSADRGQQPVIGHVIKDSAGAKAGLQSGDKILAVDGNSQPTWEDVRFEVFLRPGEPIPLKVERNGQVMDLTLTPSARQIEKEKIGEAGIEAFVPLKQVTVTTVEAGKPADQAGIKSGDKIVGVNGQKLASWSQFKGALAVSQGQPVQVQVERNGQTQDLQASPIQVDGEYRLGIGIEIQNTMVKMKTTSLAAALRYGWDYNMRIIRGTIIGFRQIFSGARSVRTSVQGPLGMAEQTVKTYNSGGWASMIPWAGFLSLNLGIFNLLPIPVLDGGMILTILLEGLMGLVGLTMTMRLRERIQSVGLVIVFALIIFVFGNDGLRIGENLYNKFSSKPDQTQTTQSQSQQQPVTAPQPQASPGK
ncbi:MAG TPA: RIP metalloprotease RseP [Blastocatellia bacterium]|nr:RIP metalloprotease RseP [Blastocatellia bacterium]HMV83326.1 RIP metalloprotease RseP [Blastocatellia bacterium]HMY72368.1 RIP metalloprotease RseP [Blastocatellia bacterium]HMZ16607.1 RIP metalloprotease RseP [Blastocatellia bacterium]HNG28200.1 RIP metalloprotease RseP [Blastocatellia bacterium]